MRRIKVFFSHFLFLIIFFCCYLSLTFIRATNGIFILLLKQLFYFIFLLFYGNSIWEELAFRSLVVGDRYFPSPYISFPPSLLHEIVGNFYGWVDYGLLWGVVGFLLLLPIFYSVFWKDIINVDILEFSSGN